jgi:hypothetical protein
MPPDFCEGFEDFVQLVVSILQEGGLSRTDYVGTTLRDHLGLERPKNALFEPWAEPRTDSRASSATSRLERELKRAEFGRRHRQLRRAHRVARQPSKQP